MTAVMIISAVLAMAIIGYMLIKKMDIKITLFAIGLLLMFVGVAMGNGIGMRGFESCGITFFDPIMAIGEQFKSTLGRAGLIILVLGGYTSYMNKIGANEVTVNTLTKPLKHVRSPYVLVPFVFLLGNLLSLVVPSASNLAIILLATLYPILKASGMTTITAAGVIATTATVMPTPLGGDNVAISEELAKIPDYAGLTASEYVFKFHAIISIPTLILMAIVHYFWQKHCDKKDLAKGIITKEKVEVSKIEEVKGSALFKTVYSLLPILPIFILLAVYILNISGMKINVSVITATFMSFIISGICELIRHRNGKKVMSDTESFFKGMGDSFGIVALLVAAGVFVTGLKTIGVISSVQEIMTGLSGSGMGFILPLVLVILTLIIVFLSGSGVALFYAMVPLMVPLATAAAISPIAVTIPMGLAGNLFRAVSPVSAVVMIVAGTTKQTPVRIVRRTAVPMVVGIVFMFVMSMIMYL